MNFCGCAIKSQSWQLCHSGFVSVKHSKRRVLRCIIAFVQIEVIVGTCEQLIFYSQMHKKTRKILKKRFFCWSALAQSCFPTIKCTQRRGLLWKTAFEVIIDTCTNRIFHRKTLKKRCFVVEYCIGVI